MTETEVDLLRLLYELTASEHARLLAERDTARERVKELEAENEALRTALRAAIPFLFEHGGHVNRHCYRGSDDGCYCGLDEAKKLMEAALAAPQQPKEKTE